MSRGVQWSLLGAAVVAALIALAGCSHYLFAEREPWRRDAEIACLNSGAVKESPERVRISAISGPGICGADFPLRVSALGDSAPLGYDDEPVRPPSAIPNAAMPQRWPVIQSNALPPLPSAPTPQYGAAPSSPPPYDAPPPSQPQYGAPPRASTQASPGQVYRWQTGPPPASQQAGPPMSLYAPGVPVPEEDDADYQPGPPRPYDGAPGMPSSMPPPTTYPPPNYSSPAYPQRAEPAPLGTERPIPLGPPRSPMATAAGQVEVKPAATLACPIVSALDIWITSAVQPAALRWFR